MDNTGGPMRDLIDSVRENFWGYTVCVGIVVAIFHFGMRSL